MANKNPPKENFFTTDRKESCTAQMNLKVPPSLLEEIKKQENWQEFVRQTLAREVKIKSASATKRGQYL